MRNCKIIMTTFLIVIASFFNAVAVVTEFTGAEIEEIITSHSLDFDFIMVDIRDDMEVESGIIASEYCKPYHLSWNFGDFREHYNDIPKDVAIVVYCRSGSRARSAVSLLANEGYETIGTLQGGINTYTGELKDSSELKPITDLPLPSYVGELTIASIKPAVRQKMDVSRAEPLLYTVTLSGKVIGIGRNGNYTPAVRLNCYRSSAEKSIGMLMLYR